MAWEMAYDASLVGPGPAVGLLVCLGLVAAARWDWRHRDRTGFPWYGPLSRSADWRAVFTGLQLVGAILATVVVAGLMVANYMAAPSARAMLRDGTARVLTGEIRGVPPPRTAPRGSQSYPVGWCSVGDVRVRDKDGAIQAAIARTADAGRRLRDGDLVRVHLDVSGRTPEILRLEVHR